MPLILCKDLELAYEGRRIVSDLNFEVNSGDYLCIVGENGSGKTTLMKTLLGLKRYSKGTIVFDENIKSNEIGYLPQQTEIQKDFPASVLEVVLSGCLNRCGIRPFYLQAEKRLATLNMEKLGIAELAKKCYRELSGGQQQRVLLARALCATKRLLVLDEPVTGLDPKASSEMYAVLEQLNSQDKITIIMVSHDLEIALQYGSHILHVGSQPLFFGKTNEYADSALASTFRGRGGE